VLTFGWEGCSSSEVSAVAEADRLSGLAMLFWMLEQRLGDGEVPLENWKRHEAPRINQLPIKNSGDIKRRGCGAQKKLTLLGESVALIELYGVELMSIGPVGFGATGGFSLSRRRSSDTFIIATIINHARGWICDTSTFSQCFKLKNNIDVYFRPSH